MNYLVVFVTIFIPHILFSQYHIEFDTPIHYPKAHQPIEVNFKVIENGWFSNTTIISSSIRISKAYIRKNGNLVYLDYVSITINSRIYDYDTMYEYYNSGKLRGWSYSYKEEVYDLGSASNMEEACLMAINNWVKNNDIN